MRKSLTNERERGCIGIVNPLVSESGFAPMKSGKKFVAESSTWNRIAEGIEDVYEDCVCDL